MFSYLNIIRKRLLSPRVLLFVGLTLTAFGTIYTITDIEADAKRDFHFACNEIQLKIDARMKAHAQILRSAAAVFNTMDKVSREEWKTFTMDQKIEQYLPGIQGIGFSLMIPRELLIQHTQEIRNQGFPDYTIKPEGDRQSYSSIVFLEPFSGRNLRAFGYDMFSEPVRRKAMEEARDHDVAALSGKVTLVQETDQDLQAGALMYVPVYRKGMAVDTVAHRRAALYGWVYSPYRMNDLMTGILVERDPTVEGRIHLQIFDSEDFSSGSLLYDSKSQEKLKMDNGTRLSQQVTLSLHNHPWHLRFTQTDKHWQYGRILGVFFGGTVISLLLFWLIVSIQNTQLKSQQLADELTVDLRESEEKYRIIFNNEIYAICIFDLETLKLLDVNDAYSKMYGYTREEIISGMTIHNFTAERQVSDAATKQAIKEGTIYIPLRYHRKKDGTVFPVEIVGGPYTWKGQKVMFALAHDITDRKASEDALITSEKRLQSIINVSPMPMAVNDRKQRVSFLNPAFFQTFGYSLEDIPDLAHWWPQAYPDVEYRQKVADAWQAELERSTQAGAPFSPQEVTVRCKDGSSKTVLVSATSFSENIEDNHLVVFYDITERKQAEEQSAKLEALNGQIQKAESLSTMAGSVAHHLNNKLGVVIGNLEMALYDLSLGADLHKKLTAAMQGALMAAEVGGLMLTYLGQKTGKRIPLDLSATCRKHLPLVQAAAPKDLILNTNLPIVGPTIRANDDQLQQLLTNLVTNAWEAVGEKKGSVNLLVKAVSQTDIPTAHRFPVDWQPQDPAYACLEVSDTGCGITEENFDRLFDPFFSTKFTGRGLGLPVVLGIVRAHDGVITVESEGYGSIFRVFLPLSAEKIPPQLGKSSQSFTREGSGTVLLIDDDEMIRDMVKTMIMHLGYTVLSAKDGIEAMEMFAQHQDAIRCVVSDVTMPRMSGWETLVALRKLSPGIPVILCSGYDEAQVLIGDHPESPQAFLHKPYQMVQLRDALAKTMAN